MDRHRIREGPDDGTGLRVSERSTAVLDRNALNATREVRLPVPAFGLLLFVGRQIIPPAKLLEHISAELRIAVLDFTADRKRSVRQQALAIALHTEACTEAQTPFRHRSAGVIQDRRARMFELGRTPAGPRQTVGLAVDRPTLGPHRIGVNGVPVLLVQLEAFRTLTGVADGPHAAVVLASDVLDQRLIIVHLDVLGQLIAETKLLGEQIHDGLIGFRLEYRVDHLGAPLQVAVGCRHRAVGLELRCGGQEVHPVFAVGHHRRGRRDDVDYDQEVQLLHGFFHFGATGLAVGRVSPEYHGPQIVLLRDILLVLEHAIDPA